MRVFEREGSRMRMGTRNGRENLLTRLLDRDYGLDKLTKTARADLSAK